MAHRKAGVVLTLWGIAQNFIAWALPADTHPLVPQVAGALAVVFVLLGLAFLLTPDEKKKTATQPPKRIGVDAGGDSKVRFKDRARIRNQDTGVRTSDTAEVSFEDDSGVE